MTGINPESGLRLPMVTTHDIERIVGQAVATHIPAERVRRMTAEPYVTSMDQEGLRVTLVISDDDDLPNDGSTLADTLLDISDRLFAAGDHRVATLHLITEDELAHIGDPEL